MTRYGIYAVSVQTSARTIKQILEADKNYSILDVDQNISDSDWEEKINSLNGSDKSLEGYTKSTAEGENEKNKRI